MAGLTVGPEWYSKGPNKQPDAGVGELLDDTTLRVAFGGAGAPDWRTTQSSPGTKYVLRRGGLTGVFNTANTPQPKIYGYDMKFDRFAFRQVTNTLDTYTWIDGKLAIPNPGGFGIDFTSLALECTGHVGEGTVVDGDDGKSLHAWKAPMEVNGMRFEGADACSPDPRELVVDKTVDVAALSKRLSVEAKWSPAGEPSDAVIRGSTSHELDRPATGGGGFPVSIAKDVEFEHKGDNAGWFTLPGSVSVPFWEALASRIRAENDSISDDEAEAKATHVFDEGDAYDWSNRTHAQVTTAANDGVAGTISPRYCWGQTGYCIDGGNVLNVRYDLAREGKVPQFFGAMNQAFDLAILEARAGVNYINPTHTKVSFGASADLEKLRLSQIDLHVDLNDPESVARFDAFVGQPVLATLVSALKDPLGLTKKITGAGLDDFIEIGVRAAFAQIDGVLSPLADALNELHGLPARAAQLLLEPLKAQLDQALSALGDAVDDKIRDLDALLPAQLELALQIPEGDPLDAAMKTQLEALLQKLDDVESAVGLVQTGLTSMNGAIGTAKATLGQLESIANNVGTTARGHITNARAFVANVNNGLRLCAGDALDLGQSNLMLGQVAQVFQTLGSVVDAMKSIQLVQFASAIAGLAGIDMSAIEGAERDIRELATNLDDRLNGAADQVRMALDCGSGGPFNDIVTKADAFLIGLDNAVQGLQSQMTGAVTTLESRLDLLSDQLGAAVTVVSASQGVVTEMKGIVTDVLSRNIADHLGLTEADLRLRMKIGPVAWFDPVGNKTFGDVIVELIRGPVDLLIAFAAQEVQAALDGFLQAVPFPSPDELREHLVNLVMNHPAIEQLDHLLHENLVFVLEDLTDVTGHLFDQVNEVLQDIVEQLEGALNDALDAANSVVKNMPYFSAKMDGYATIAGNELERLHVEAEWKASANSDENSTSYNAALDVTSWNANNKAGGCVADGSGFLDAVISTTNLPIDVGGAELLIKKLFVGFTLANLAPIGVFGGIDTEGVLDFKAFQLFDIGLQTGIGALETYIGAKAAGAFDDISMQVAFLLGRTCNKDVLAALDPQVAEFIDLPGGVFQGGYVRGGASFPIWSNGCLLTVGVGADAGAWLLFGPAGVKIGGLVGGSAYGKALCIAALRGAITVLADYYDGNVSFQGEGFGVAGIGFDCDPGTWTSVARSRKDSWCGTGDASFKATYKNGWDVSGLNTSAIH